MPEKQQAYPSCVSVFRGGRDAPDKEAYTKLWAGLISRLEQDAGR